MFNLIKQANGIVLKNASQVGPFWINVLLDKRLGLATLCEVFMGLAIVCFIGLAWCIRNRLRSRTGKVILTVWTCLQTFSLFISFSFLRGVEDTIDDFPVVTYSGLEKSFPQRVIPVLIGNDDKQFALLVVLPDAKPTEPQKLILYLPRDQVKWMTVVSLKPLQLLGKLDDVERDPSLLPPE
jgi:hypothetical protein